MCAPKSAQKSTNRFIPATGWDIFLPVRVFDGWERTACNVACRLPNLLRDAGFQDVEELFTCNSLLGTIRTYRARR